MYKHLLQKDVQNLLLQKNKREKKQLSGYKQCYTYKNQRENHIHSGHPCEHTKLNNFFVAKTVSWQDQVTTGSRKNNQLRLILHKDNNCSFPDAAPRSTTSSSSTE